MLETLASLPTNTINKYQSVFADLGRTLIDRDEALRCVQLALLARQHVLIWGDSGEGKTTLANAVFKRFPSPDLPEDVFRVQFTRDMPPEVLFGGYDIKALQQGDVRYNAQGSLLTCRFLFGDEVFDASDFVLRATLGVLSEERTFRAGKQVLDRVPLHSAILTSNFRRENAATTAFLNRILCQYQVAAGPSVTHRSMLDMMGETNKHHNVPHETLPYPELEELADIVSGRNPELSILLPWSVVYLKNKVVNAFVELANSKSAAIPQSGKARTNNEADSDTVLQAVEGVGFPLSLVKGSLRRFVETLIAQHPVNQQAVSPEKTASLTGDYAVTSSRGKQLTGLLYASALLDKRGTITNQDLKALRYGIYPQSEAGTILDDHFRQALNEALATDSKEVAQAEDLLSCINVMELLTGKAAIAVLPARMAQRIVDHPFIADPAANFSLSLIKHAVAELTPVSHEIFAMRAAALAKIERMEQMPDFKQLTRSRRKHFPVFIYN